MIGRILSSLFVVVLMAAAAQLARPISLRGVDISPDGHVLARQVLPNDVTIEAGDRVISIDDASFANVPEISHVIPPFAAKAHVRIASLQDARSIQLDAGALEGKLPERLRPTYYILSINGVPAFGQSPVAVAQALRNEGQATVVSIPTQGLISTNVSIARGTPPVQVWIAMVIAILSLVLIWRGMATLGLTLGLGVSGVVLWLEVAYSTARLAGLAVLCVAAAMLAWIVLRELAQGGGIFAARANRHPIESVGAGLLGAFERLEESLGIPVHVVVGSSQQGVEMTRDYQRIVIEPAASMLTASLSMLAIEGGVFPRVDVGGAVPDPWDDPLADLDAAAGIACAVPIPDYGHGQDQWAFLLVRIADSPSSSQLLDPLATAAALWAEAGLKENIAVQATHALLRMVRTAGYANSPAGTKHREPSPRPRAQSAVDAARTPPVSANKHLEFSNTDTPDELQGVAEGVGRPRIVRREDFERGPDPQDRQTLSSVASNARLGVQAQTEPSSTSAPDATRALVGHWMRRWHSEYPVDDPRCLSDEDWARLAPLDDDQGPALLYGEAGTGKAFAARALYAQSSRRGRPIVAIDCAVLGESSVDLEIFGLRDEPGVIEGIAGGAMILASSCTLSGAFLRTIFERAATLDIRLFLLERQSGSRVQLPNTSVGERVAAQIADRVVRMPSLRERPDRVIDEANRLMEAYCTMYGIGGTRSLDPGAERLLRSMDFPGNYWDLQAVIRAAVLRTDVDVLDARAILGMRGNEMSHEVERVSDDREREQLIATLRKMDGNKLEAAHLLGISRDALVRRMKRHGLL